MGRPARRALNIRLLAIGTVLLLAWIAVAARLFEVQAVRAEAYAARGMEQRLRREVLAADRGTIFDRDGNELAVTVDAITVYANPLQVEDPAAAARLIAPFAGVETEDLEERLRRDAGFVYVTRQLDRRRAEVIGDFDLPGIYLTQEPRRTYPSGRLAANVIGFVRKDDNVGLEGLELAHNEVLQGRPGELLVEKDRAGEVDIPLGEYELVPPEPGGDLVLTIDREIQFQAEQTLARTVDRFGAAGGSVVVLQPETGEILAMANLPTFDPNERSGVDPEAFRNRAVTDLYEPGSTQKLITVTAAIEEGLVKPADVFHIPDELVINDKVYEDVGGHPPDLTVSDIVTYSSNVGTILLQRRVGNEVLHRYLADFGFGRPSGVGFPGEARGVLHSPEDWCHSTCGASTAIGYGVSVTALQMASAFAIIANDGVWVGPQLVAEIVNGDGSRESGPRLERRVVSEETAVQMRVMLGGVVERGTGVNARITGYQVGGKTGTTEKFVAELGEYGDDVVSSFIGMAPLDDPKVVIAVTIDAPAGGEFGGTVAAPAFAEIALSSLHQLGVPPDAD